MAGRKGPAGGAARLLLLLAAAGALGALGAAAAAKEGKGKAPGKRALVLTDAAGRAGGTHSELLAQVAALGWEAEVRPANAPGPALREWGVWRYDAVLVLSASATGEPPPLPAPSPAVPLAPAARVRVRSPPAPAPPPRRRAHVRSAGRWARGGRVGASRAGALRAGATDRPLGTSPLCRGR